MDSFLFWVIIVAIWSIIPALVSAMLLFMRILADERRLEAMEIRKLDFDAIMAELSKVKSAVLDAQADIDSQKESLGFLNSKWNSRLRFEQAADKRNAKEKEGKNGSAERDDIDGEKIPEQYRLPLNMPTPAPTPPRRRAFGQIT